MIYTTRDSIRLKVNRIPRQVIDRFIGEKPEPEPPVREIETWAGDSEEVLDHDDAGYLMERRAWQIAFGREMLGLLVQAVEMPACPHARAELDELEALGLAGDEATYLCHKALRSDEDLNAVVELTLYLSTVTARGLLEAQREFGVTWGGKPVQVMGGPADESQGARANGVFGDRQAARWAWYRWDEFCELAGPEQSRIVALYRLTNRLEVLASR